MERPASDYELRTAYYAGLGGFAGDPDVARDLGIPVGDEDYESHVSSGQTVGSLTRDAEARQAEAKPDEDRARLAAFCGDCLIDVAPGDNCGHVVVASNGGRHIKG